MWGEWQDIETAPDGQHLLLYGSQKAGNDDGVRYSGPIVFSGYFDEVDDAWCAHGSTWLGPFFEPTHWMPLPPAPIHPETGED